MNNLKVGDKVRLDSKAIENSEYKFQFDGKVKESVYVYDVIDHINPTFAFKTSPKSKHNGCLPMSFIESVISSGHKLYY